MSLYLNGARRFGCYDDYNDSPVCCFDPGANPAVAIGNLNSAAPAQYFPGFIDEVRLSSVALEPSQFLDAFPPVSPSAGLVAGWPGDGNAADIVGQQNGTLVDGNYTPLKPGWPST
jgi:hypothetical protein